MNPDKITIIAELKPDFVGHNSKIQQLNKYFRKRVPKVARELYYYRVLGHHNLTSSDNKILLVHTLSHIKERVHIDSPSYRRIREPVTGFLVIYRYLGFPWDIDNLVNRLKDSIEPIQRACYSIELFVSKLV
jgi:hypothetical protein